MDNKTVKGLLVAKIIYYILVFAWLLQIATGSKMDTPMMIQTTVLIGYGLILNFRMRQQNNKRK